LGHRLSHFEYFINGRAAGGQRCWAIECSNRPKARHQSGDNQESRAGLTHTINRACNSGV